MIRRLAAITLWLLVGHAAWVALFWGLLHVPESSVWMLAVSAAVALGLVVLAATLTGGASAAWDTTRGVTTGLRRGVGLAPAAVAAAVVFGALWWATGLVLEWHSGIAGQMDAWLIARTGRTDTRPVHFVIFWLAMFVRWSFGLTLASSLLAALATSGPRAATEDGWLRSVLAPSRWLALTFWFVLLVAIPWHLVDWRPARLSLGLEPWFVAAKFSAIAVSMAAGWALVLRAGHGATKKI